jgi:uridine kinase
MGLDLAAVVGKIVDARRSVPVPRSVLVAVTGIDGCGKGYITTQIVNALQARGVRTASINVDGWLNLPHVRFNDSNPAEHFYLHAIRFDQLFGELVLPLRDRRSLRLEAEYAEEAATSFRTHLYAFEDIDVIVLEGIYLLKRQFQSHYDLSFWIECSFETALERAIERGQEGLPPAETVAAYRKIYFPAQEIHLERDKPRAAASATINNDPRLGATWGTLRRDPRRR